MNISRLASICFAIVLAALLPLSPQAHAHAHLIASTPAANSHVPAAATIDLTFNEPLVARASRITLNRIEGGKPVKVDHVEISLDNDGKTLRATPMHPLPKGSYKVEWRAVGGDNHPMSGDFTFMIH